MSEALYASCIQHISTLYVGNNRATELHCVHTIVAVCVRRRRWPRRRHRLQIGVGARRVVVLVVVVIFIGCNRGGGCDDVSRFPGETFSRSVAAERRLRISRPIDGGGLVRPDGQRPPYGFPLHRLLADHVEKVRSVCVGADVGISRTGLACGCCARCLSWLRPVSAVVRRYYALHFKAGLCDAVDDDSLVCVGVGLHRSLLASADCITTLAVCSRTNAIHVLFRHAH